MTTASIASSSASRPVVAWLALCLLIVALMVVIGGLTRLTESGLSIVEWQPVAGMFPPMSEESWQAEFQKYQASPQYQQVNRGMSLEEFKHIFWLEYIHRLIGRVVGLVFFLPLAFFYFTKRIPNRLALRMLGIFVLGGIQGIIGWYMVKSGLIDDPRVSPYRLALHLGVAFVIFALILRTILGLTWRENIPAFRTSRAVAFGATLLLGLIFLQVLLGALVAGNDAGLIYNSFPLMDGRWIPAELSFFPIGPHSFFDNPALVQFNHRIGAWAITGFTLFYWCWGVRYAREPQLLRAAFFLLPVMVLLQAALGIKTLIDGVPTGLASLHQVTALALFAVAVTIHFGLHKNIKDARNT